MIKIKTFHLLIFIQYTLNVIIYFILYKFLLLSEKNKLISN